VVDGVQVGIVSWSVKPCTVQGFPGVFTKDSTQLGWIQRQVAA
jgi:trypsin